MPGNGYNYVFAELVSAAAWALYSQEDPCDPVAGLALWRRLLNREPRLVLLLLLRGC
jgi:Zn-dependent oligopeptidase